MSIAAMPRTCAECPWLLSSAPGRFPPERYYDLAHTCRPGGWPQPMFACHMTPEEGTRACAGMLIALRDDWPNMVRWQVMKGNIDPEQITASGPLYPTYEAMAEANGCDPSALEG